MTQDALIPRMEEMEGATDARTCLVRDEAVRGLNTWEELDGTAYQNGKGGEFST